MGLTAWIFPMMAVVGLTITVRTGHSRLDGPSSAQARRENRYLGPSGMLRLAADRQRGSDQIQQRPA
jgi:hypothetical protein